MSRVLLMFCMLFIVNLCMGQGRTAKSIETEIELYESRILEKERAMAKNIANNSSASNTALAADLRAYEAQIRNLLEELKTVQNTDRTEAAFVALQGRLHRLNADQELLLQKNQELKQQIQKLKQALIDCDGPMSNSTVVASAPEKKQFTDQRDEAVYNLVKIGNQWWMAENLRYNIKGSLLTSKGTLLEYGRLYTWEQAKGACPSGWHLPSDAEWQALELAQGMSAVEVSKKGYRGSIAAQLKSTTLWVGAQNNTNSSGFNVFPAGMKWSNKFLGEGTMAHFWTSSEDKKGYIWQRSFSHRDQQISRSTARGDNGYSCRCVQD